MVIADARRYKQPAWRARGFWTTLRYRIRRSRRLGSLSCRLVLWPLDVLITLVGPYRSDAELPSLARIGPGFYLPHPQGVVLSSGSRIGPNVSLFQQVTLGAWNDQSPRVHAQTSIFAGAKIIGGVTLGRRVFVGANATVLRSVPDWHSAVGVPASNHPRRRVADSNVETIDLG